jgi:hypothetical protein
MEKIDDKKISKGSIYIKQCIGNDNYKHFAFIQIDDSNP